MEKREKSNIILAIAGMSVSKLGSYIYTFAIGLYVLKLTGSGQTFAVTLMFGILPRVILGPFVGNLADRMNKKLLVVGSDLFSGILMAAIFTYAIDGELTIPIIYGATLLLSISATFLETAFIASQRDLVKLESLTRVGSLRHSTDSIINLLSPIIGGLIYALVPIYIFLLINGISFLSSAVSELFIDFNYNKVIENKKKNSPFFADMKSGFIYFKKQPQIKTISKYALILNFLLAPVAVVLPYTLVSIMKIDESIYGIIMAVMSIGALGGALIVGKLNSKLTYRYFVRTMFILALSFILMGISMNVIFGNASVTLIIIGFSGFILGASITSINIPLGVFFQTSVEPAYLGRVSSIIGTLASAISPAAYLLFGFLTKHFSPFLIITSCGIMVIFIILTMINNKNLKTLGDSKTDVSESVKSAKVTV